MLESVVVALSEKLLVVVGAWLSDVVKDGEMAAEPEFVAEVVLDAIVERVGALVADASSVAESVMERVWVGGDEGEAVDRPDAEAAAEPERETVTETLCVVSVDAEVENVGREGVASAEGVTVAQPETPPEGVAESEFASEPVGDWVGDRDAARENEAAAVDDAAPDAERLRAGECVADATDVSDPELAGVELTDVEPELLGLECGVLESLASGDDDADGASDELSAPVMVRVAGTVTEMEKPVESDAVTEAEASGLSESDRLGVAAPEADSEPDKLPKVVSDADDAADAE